MPCKSITTLNLNLQRWKDELYSNMEIAGKTERSKAIELGNIDADGVPYITVYLDGGWSKRSYGHSYNAASGTVSCLFSVFVFVFCI